VHGAEEEKSQKEKVEFSEMAQKAPERGFFQ